MKKLLSISFVFISIVSLAQQDIQNSQYMFNLFAINPAYAGSKDVLVANVSHRSQWVGFDGAPQTQIVSVHAPITKLKIGVGLEVSNETIGPRTVQGLHTAYAYRIRLGKGKIGFGLKAGIYNFTYQWDELNYERKDDYVIGNGTESRIVPNFNFGSYYYDKVNYAGFELAHLTKSKLYSPDSASNVFATLYPHLSLFGGRAVELNDKFAIKASFLARIAQNTPGYADVNVSAFYNKRIWLGVSYRTTQSLVFISQYYINQKLRIGYSYDLSLGKFAKQQSGSHEIYLGLDLNVFKTETLSPRYF